MLITMHRTTIKTRRTRQKLHSHSFHTSRQQSGGAATKNRPNNHHNSLPPSIFPYQSCRAAKVQRRTTFASERASARARAYPPMKCQAKCANLGISQLGRNFWRLPAVDWVRNRRSGLWVEWVSRGTASLIAYKASEGMLRCALSDKYL